jgi:hypothetical protein
MDMTAVQAFVSTTLIDVGFKIWARSPSGSSVAG